MKQPKLSNLKINKLGTKNIRSMACESNKIKITINIDKKSLDKLKEIASRTGGSYQKILNDVLKNGLSKKNEAEDRLSKLEKEIVKIKKRLAA